MSINLDNREYDIVCLCGSTKFKDYFQSVNHNLTLAGEVVLSVGCFMHADNVPISDEQKSALDKLHLIKIDMADYIFVINPGGYIGESTFREIRYAAMLGKPIVFLEEVADGFLEQFVLD